jgi:hypothetical protein
MTHPTFFWNTPAVQSLPAPGTGERLPVHLLLFINHNDHALAVARVDYL